MEYIRPKSVDEYFNINSVNTIFAGGTDLIPRYERGETLPETLIDIKKIDDLHGALKSGLSVRLAVLDLLRRKKISRRGKSLFLTSLGIKEGRQLIRSHRLWESYLCDQLSVCAEDVHLQAHQLEHYTDRYLQSELDRETGHPQLDPHQRKIPESPPPSDT